MNSLLEDFLPGDKVRSCKDCSDVTEEWYEGIIHSIIETQTGRIIINILRDDGISGQGPSGSWETSYSNIDEIFIEHIFKQREWDDEYNVYRGRQGEATAR